MTFGVPLFSVVRPAWLQPYQDDNVFTQTAHASLTHEEVIPHKPSHQKISPRKPYQSGSQPYRAGSGQFPIQPRLLPPALITR